MARTTIHLMRHGEVHNPGGILYGRLPGYHLSTLGHQMALQVADHAYVLESGKIALSGTGEELAATDAIKKAYLGG